MSTVEPSPLAKALFVIAAFILMFIEIVALRAFYKEQDAQNRQVVGMLAELLKVNSAREKAHIGTQSPSETTRRIQQLSYDILDWLSQRLSTDLRFEMFGWDSAKVKQYNDDTVMLYKEKFSDRVQKMRDWMASFGFRDPNLDSFIGRPVDHPLVIRMIAERLGEIAGVASKAEAERKRPG